MKHVLTALVILVPLLVSSAEVMGAADVVQAQAVTPGQLNSATSSFNPPVRGSSSDNEALQLLLDHSNQQQRELESLRGLIEEMAFKLRRLEKGSLERYTDLDSRLSELSKSQPAVSSNGRSTRAPFSSSDASSRTIRADSRPPTSLSGRSSSQSIPGGDELNRPNGAPVASNNTISGRTSDTRQSTLQPRVLSDLQLYQAALDSLLQDSQYERAISEFDQYLSVYPNGRYVANAWYWKGQSFDNLSRFVDAKDAYEIVLNQHPDDPKAVDSMYALGVVFNRMGDTANSRRLLTELMSKYANSGAANLADIYLRGLN